MTNAEGQETADAYRGAAIERVNAAWNQVREGGEWQYDLLRGIADLLLAIDTRLAHPVAPIEPGLCPSKVASPVEVARAFYCQLKAGHAGLHEQGDVTWTDLDAAGAA